MTGDRSRHPLTRALKEELKGCKTVLDLGCGGSSMLQYVEGVEYSLGVECFPRYIEESKAARIHTEYKQLDILSFKSPRDSFDAVILIDVLEHLTKDDGARLLRGMNRWARNKVVVVVPNGFFEQGDTLGDGNEKQRHLSGWSAGELESFGYRVSGFDGWRRLRGEAGNIIQTRTRAGHYLLAAISLLSEPLTGKYPNHAYHLFAVMEKPRDPNAPKDPYKLYLESREKSS